jgi:hypothetical protein
MLRRALGFSLAALLLLAVPPLACEQAPRTPVNARSIGAATAIACSPCQACPSPLVCSAGICVAPASSVALAITTATPAFTSTVNGHIFASFNYAVQNVGSTDFSLTTSCSCAAGGQACSYPFVCSGTAGACSNSNVPSVTLSSLWTFNLLDSSGNAAGAPVTICGDFGVNDTNNIACPSGRGSATQPGDERLQVGCTETFSGVAAPGNGIDITGLHGVFTLQACLNVNEIGISAAAGTACTATALPLCDPGEQACGSQCANVQSDPQNCGSCGHSCPANDVCTNGNCVCVPHCASGSCGGSDGCNGTCECPASEYCSNGSCVNCPCSAGYCGVNSCGRSCANCPTGEDCTNHSCQHICGAGLIYCPATDSCVKSATECGDGVAAHPKACHRPHERWCAATETCIEAAKNCPGSRPAGPSLR